MDNECTLGHEHAHVDTYSTHLAYVRRPHCTAMGLIPFLFCCILTSRDGDFRLVCVFSGDGASTVSVFCPLMCVLRWLARVPLTQVYGLIPRMCAISLTTLQHI